MIADAFGCSVRTIFRDLAGSPSTDPHTEEFRRSLVLEAGVCFVKRCGEAPTTVTWNPTLAFGSNERQRRWSLEGWRAAHDPETQRPWPHEAEAGELWRSDGGFHAFIAAVQNALNGDLENYVPVPLPSKHLAECALGALLPAPPSLPRANLWAAFALLGPGYESLHHIWLQRPHSDVWLQERSDARRRDQRLPPRAAATREPEPACPRIFGEYQPIDPGVGEAFFGNLPPNQLYSHDQREALWQLRILLAFLDSPFVSPSNTIGTMTADMVMTLLICHSVRSDLIIRLEIGDGGLLLTWPLGRDTNGGHWTPRVSDLVEGLLHGYNRQVIIRRGDRILESTTMIATESCRRHASVYRPRTGTFGAGLGAPLRRRTVETRRIRFMADAPRAVQQWLLDIVSPGQARQWLELGCSRTAVRHARTRFYRTHAGVIARSISKLAAITLPKPP